MQVLTLTKYSYEGPSSRYRFYNYKENFKKNNIEMIIQPLFGKKYFMTKRKWQKMFVAFFYYIKRFLLVLDVIAFPKEYDLVVIEYELFPYFPSWFECLFSKRGIKYIVDYDDAIFHKYDIHRNGIIQKLLKDKIAKVMGYAEYVVVCNDYLEGYAKKYNDAIFRLLTVVLLEKYKDAMKTFDKKDESFVVGWIGSRTTSKYILEILPAIERFVEQYPAVRFDLVGFDGDLLSMDIQKKHHLNIIKWEEEKEIEHILMFDIGIMPLHDDPWSRGKCGFKLVQYMSCKKPVIASPVGMNRTLVEDGTNGFLVKNLDEWFTAFEKLYLSKELRTKMAKNNFLKIEKEYNHQKNCEKYIKLIKSLTKKGNE